MRWIRFRYSGAVCYGILQGQRVDVVDGDPFNGYTSRGDTLALADVELLIPFEPKTFYAAGLNYSEHVTEAARFLGQEPNFPAKPDIGYRANNALVAHEAEVVIPADATEQVNYEGELVVVIGREAKGLSEENALSCVLGYTIGNDVSERSWQKEDKTMWRAKNTDTFAPMGPWIETEVSLADMRTTVKLNGEAQVEFATNDMLFGVERYIAAMTRYLTLYPGDMIWMGTEGKSPNLKHGDTVEVTIEPIGTLRNKFVLEGAS